MPRRTFEERLQEIETGCQVYVGRRDKDGYGKHRDYSTGKVREVRAHRFALEKALGRPVAPGLLALHECDNPPCCKVGPGHVYEGTPRQNSLDAISRGRLVPNQAGLELGRQWRKLSREDEQRVRDRYAKGGISQREVAAEFGISQQLVSNLVRSPSW